MEATLASLDEQVEFEAALAEALPRELAKPTPERVVDGKIVIWSPQEGSQEEFMSCPLFECLYHGTRGPGKTDALLMDFAQDVGKHGPAWRGIIFRQTYPQLADVVAKSQRWFRQIFPEARFNKSKMQWEFETGEVLLFRHMARPEDYWNYHGHEYPWIGWEELTNWANDQCYKSMFSCCRSSTLPPMVPRKIRSTTNPYGVGHNWVKERFELHDGWWKTKVLLDPVNPETKRKEKPRASIHGHLRENKILLASDPDYSDTIAASASGKAQRLAWEDGRWDVVAGGMFDDVWSYTRNQLPPFAVPESWRIDRSFDWGSSKPFSVGWWAQSDGSDLAMPDGQVFSTVKGDLFRIAEWYGFTGKANEGLRMLATDIAKGIVERELSWQFRRPGDRRCRVQAGPADSSIFTVENGRSIALDMAEPVRVGAEMYPGVRWLPSDKSPGSRVAGWEQMRTMIRSARPAKKGIPRERPGLFVVAENCPNWIRTVIGLPRDMTKMDDVDTDAEDHIADETRYRVRMTKATIREGTTEGLQ